MRSAQHINPWLWILNGYRKQTKYPSSPSSEKEKRTQRHFHQLLKQKETPCSSSPPLKKKEAKEKGISKFLCSEEKKGKCLASTRKYHIDPRSILLLLLLLYRSTGRTIYTYTRATAVETDSSIERDLWRLRY